MPRHIHFIGIGGIGVSGVAQLALEKGDRVSGSDARESPITRRLERLGAAVRIGHHPEHVRGAGLVVYSSAIRPDNPELAAARAAKIPVLRRAEFLCELMADKTVVTVTGAHGKTTTSSLAAKLLMSAGLRPTVAVGGILREDGDNAKFNDSPYFVAEADESDGSFLCYSPTYSIITNIDEEHMDHYRTRERLLADFARFVRQTKKEGCVFYFREDEALDSIVKRSGVRGASFGFSGDADFGAENIALEPCRVRFTSVSRGKAMGEVSLNLTGRHNVLNALAVIALGAELGIDFSRVRQALGEFQGVERRFQIRREDEAVLIVDDYAHHPTEIAATIEAAKVCRRRRVVVVFQPHRYSRTQLLWDRFAVCFRDSDYLVVTDIYAAGEEPLEGVSGRLLADEIRRVSSMPVDYVDRGHLVRHVRFVVRPDDLVLFLGAGDITKASDEFAKEFPQEGRVG